MKKVVILQHRLLHYRTGLFNQLREQCALHNIDLQLVYGQATRREELKKDEADLSWAIKVKNKYIEIGERDWIWQPFPSNLWDADLVIIMQESRIISNYPLLLKGLFGKHKVAYWGHGANFQSNTPTGLRERWKQILLTRVNWWFAYTQITVDLLKSSGYSTQQTTCLNNAIDTNSFKQDLATVTESELSRLRQTNTMTNDATAAIFCGSLYPDKRLEFLIEACDYIQKQKSDFHCFIIGDGPSMPAMRNAAKTRPWLHLLGIKKGRDKAKYFRLANFMLNPGTVGLHIVDAFCAGLVLLTTNNAKHSPEIAYLRQGENGYMTADCTKDYADTALKLINDKKQLNQLKETVLNEASLYTQERMVENFTKGIKDCLTTT